MAIPATAVGNDGVAAVRVLATRDIPAERRGAADLDRTHDIQLCMTHVAAVGLTPSGAEAAADLRDVQGWTVHVYRRLLRRVLLGGERRELIERAQHIAQNLARDVRVAGRRVEFGMAEQNLNHADIHPLIE